MARIAMSQQTTLSGVFHRYKRYIALSLIISLLLVPVFDSFIIQRDRNRNMVYGELFWQEGLAVYDISDRDLNETYNVPEDHLLTGVLNVTYEYPIVTLLFYAALAAIEPGIYSPHYIANWVLVILVHINLLLFLYVGRGNEDRRWFKQFFAIFYVFGLTFSIGFAKAEPLTDLIWLTAIVLLQRKKYWESNAILGLAVQTKLYPVMAFPIFFLASPIASIAFFAIIAITSLPLLLSGMGYSALLAHLLNSSGYSAIITNPFYLGLSLANSWSIIAPAVLVIAFIYCVFETRPFGPIPVPTLNLRIVSPKAILIFAMPLVLVLFSWVLIWYYAWFLIPVLMLERNDDKKRYRWMILAIVIAHFLGILINFDYFLSGPIAEFFGHLRP
ncbi:MAG: hypothetical protein ACXADL_01965 [Candidatus Thorarchaeota archaeon]